MAQKLIFNRGEADEREITLKYELKKSCPECPYTAKSKGWIGHHDSAMEFHDIAKVDQPFPCHMSVGQACVGNAVYMNRLCKRSHDADKSDFQNRLRENNNEDVLFSFDGEALVNFHGC